MDIVLRLLFAPRPIGPNYLAMSPINREPSSRAKWHLPSHAPTFGFRPVYGSCTTGPWCLGRHLLDPGKDRHARTPAFW